MKRLWNWNLGWLAAALLLLAAVAVIYWRYDRLPSEVVIATGPEHGRYRQLSESLADAIRSELGVNVRTIETAGSLANLRQIESGTVDFALYQHGTRDRLDDNRALAAAHQPQFVANMYLEVAHLLVRHDVELSRPEDWIGKRIAVGTQDSGDHAFSLLLLNHLGLILEDIQPRHLDYGEIKDFFHAGELDAAIITTGTRAQVLLDLLGQADSSGVDVREIPFARALAERSLGVSRYVIPAAYYRAQAPSEPLEAVETVAFRAQLLTHDGVPSTLVEAVTRIALDEQFQKRNGLGELFEQKAEFAREQPEFSLHSGALGVYEPELKPLLNTDFVEATEGIRSFVVWLLITFYLGFRWWRDRRNRKQEHRLNRYIQKVLDIERRQVDFDQTPGSDDVKPLQDLLDEVTRLRQDALRIFDAHQLNEDRAVDCFIEMCHALSDKINAKLTRQRLSAEFARLEQVLTRERGE